MSRVRGHGPLLRLYPVAWRERYGDELASLIESVDGGRGAWRVKADVATGAIRERLRSAGLGGDGPPGERSRSGSLIVLCAWTAFVLAGAAVQKASEHWQGATPSSRQGLPAAAFDVLVAGALAGTILVLIGIAGAVPSVIRLLRSGGWPTIRRPVLRALALTTVTMGLTAALASWAHRLTEAQRNGHDLVYGSAFVLWALLVAACLLAWAAAAVQTARRLELPVAVLRLDAWLAAGVTAAMATITIATTVWWGAVSSAAPWFFSGGAEGTRGTAFAPQLVVAGVLMLAATAIGAAGARRALACRPASTVER